MSRWYIYLVRCADGSLYTGISKDLKKRINTHNAGRGGAYTRSHRPVVLVWKEKMSSESAARKREAEIKQWTKLEKENFINRNSAP